MNIFDIPAQLIILDIISIAAALGVGYYATRMFLHMRRGRLEKGWNWIILGALMTAIGYFFLTIEDFFLARSFYYSSLDYVGTVVCTIGLVVLMFGIRSHYSAWSLNRTPKVDIVSRVRNREKSETLSDSA
ncbi:MAG TPA: hypothetical protein VN739_06645 [Nitrososphaerales archaeon]|nr:hypothetical protein [Nitrososphaerales archaeon]